MLDDQYSLVSITRIGTCASWRTGFDRNAGILTLESADGQTLEASTPNGPVVVGHFYDDRKVTGHAVEGPWSQWLSDAADRPLTLVRATPSGGAFDEHASERR